MSSNLSLAARLAATRELPPPAVCRAIREAAGVSQRDLAKAVGCSYQTILNYEYGRRRPKPDLLIKYVALLADMAEALR